jgi:hypothetical protein
MKLLFINNYLDVKQYHLACALTDQYNVECHFAYLLPSTKHDWKGVVKEFPKLKTMLIHLRNHKGLITKKIMKDDPLLPFVTTVPYHKVKNHLSIFDWVYCSSDSNYIPKELYRSNSNLWLDIEDLRLFREYATNQQLAYEKELINKFSLISFGSEQELFFAKWKYKSIKKTNKPCFVIYPRVARRTIPKTFASKTKEFSLVIIGNIWNDQSYRNYYPVIKKILTENTFPVTLFLFNSWNKFMWTTFKKLEEQYKNKNKQFTVKEFVPYGSIKQALSKYHVGLVYLPQHFKKLTVTFGMKPYEYVYANVQPASIGTRIFDQIHPQKEFGYICQTNTIRENYQNNIKNFDQENNLMDNNLKELRNEVMINE